MASLYVGIGGLLGVLSRYGIGRLTLHHHGLLYLIASVIGGIAAAAAGYALGRRLVAYS
jgi:fluoride ion exporter CrcB/FEX